MTTDFETKTMLLSELNPAAYNPREITDQALAGLTKSVERFGLVQPVIWNKQTGNVVGGHQRLKALKSLGKKETIVVVVDMPEAEEKALNVSLNNPKIQGDFTDGLGVLLTDIEIDLPDLDFGEIGLDDLEIPDVDIETEIGDQNGDAGSGLEKITILADDPRHTVSPGEIWQMGPHVLICEDVFTGWPTWKKHLLEGVVFCPYPGPMVALSKKAEENPLVLVQPDPLICGYIVDRYAESRVDDAVERIP